jgi:hypothetical protein
LGSDALCLELEVRVSGCTVCMGHEDEEARGMRPLEWWGGGGEQGRGTVSGLTGAVLRTAPPSSRGMKFPAPPRPMLRMASDMVNRRSP